MKYLAGWLFFFSVLLSATPVLAVQTHGGMEGLVSHQIGHILFLVGMGYLLCRLNCRRIEGPGWYSFKLFLWSIILWNLITIAGHWLHEIITPACFIRTDGVITAFQVNSLTDLLFYASRLDHFLLVPAFFFLLIALYQWRNHR